MGRKFNERSNMFVMKVERVQRIGQITERGIIERLREIQDQKQMNQIKSKIKYV